MADLSRRIFSLVDLINSLTFAIVVEGALITGIVTGV